MRAPLLTCSPADFDGLDSLIDVVPVDAGQARLDQTVRMLRSDWRRPFVTRS